MAGRAAPVNRVDPALLVTPAVLATALRVPGLFTDFWLDEIWTVKIVSQMQLGTRRLHETSDIRTTTT